VHTAASAVGIWSHLHRCHHDNRIGRCKSQSVADKSPAGSDGCCIPGVAGAFCSWACLLGELKLDFAQLSEYERFTYNILQRFICQLQRFNAKRLFKTLAIGIVVAKHGRGEPACVRVATDQHPLIAGVVMRIADILQPKLMAAGEFGNCRQLSGGHAINEFHLLRNGCHILGAHIQHAHQIRRWLLFLQLVAGFAVGNIVYPGNGHRFDAARSIVMKHTDAVPRSALTLLRTARTGSLISSLNFYAEVMSSPVWQECGQHMVGESHRLLHMQQQYIGLWYRLKTVHPADLFVVAPMGRSFRFATAQ